MTAVNPQISPGFRKLAQDWRVWTPCWKHQGSRSYLDVEAQVQACQNKPEPE